MQFNLKSPTTPIGLALGSGLRVTVVAATESLAVSTAVGAGIGLLFSLLYAQKSSDREESAAENDESVHGED